jgi:hypothetical protein
VNTWEKHFGYLITVLQMPRELPRLSRVERALAIDDPQRSSDGDLCLPEGER